MTRSQMILSAILVCLAAEASICVRAQDAPPRPVNDPAQMKWLLREWERRTDGLKTLEVHFYLVDKSSKWMDESHHEGVAIFKGPDLVSIDFWKLKVVRDGKGHLVPVKDPNVESGSLKSHVRRLVRVKDAVWQYIDDGRRIYVFPRADGERQRIFDECPFIFLFKIKADEAEARYRWSLVGENANYYIVKVFPRHKMDRASFKIALILLHKESLLPQRVRLVSPDGTRTWQYTLDRQRPNAPIDDQIFQWGDLPGWTVQKNLFNLFRLPKYDDG